MNNYDDIINLKRPISRHPKMSIEERSSLFSSFDPLDGYDESIKLSNIFKEEKATLTDDEKQIINNKLKNSNNIDSITYYDEKLYKYMKEYSKIKKIDVINRVVILDNNKKININDIKKID